MLSKFFSLACAFSYLSSVAAGPKPKPAPASCVDVLLYDTYGDGWGVDTFLQYNNESYALLSDWEAGVPISNGSQCSTRVHRFCSEDSKYSFRLNDFSVSPSKGWEVFFAVKYLGKFFYGTVGTEIVIDHFDVDFEKIFDDKPPKNQCEPCAHRAEGSNITTVLPISLHDARGKSWYQKAGPKDVVDIEGFDVPAVLVYPKYFITRTPDTRGRKLFDMVEPYGRLITEGTMCAPKGEEVCVETLEDGNYKFFVSGHAQGDESWNFCNASGVVGEELHFYIEGGVCFPEHKSSAEYICSTRPQKPTSSSEQLDAELLDSAVAPSVAMTVEIVAAGSLFVLALLFVASKVFKTLAEETKFVELSQSSHHAAPRDIVF